MNCFFCKATLTDAELRYGKSVLFCMTCTKCYKQHERAIEENRSNV